MCPEIEKSPQERARYGIGQVADQAAAGRNKGPELDGKSIALDDLDIRRSTRCQAGCQVPVELDRDDLPCTPSKRKRQSAPPRADLQEDLVRLGVDETQQALD